MISVIVATCFFVFIVLGNTSELYYATNVRNSVQAKAEDWKATVTCFGPGNRTAFGKTSKHIFRMTLYGGRIRFTNRRTFAKSI